MGASQSQPPKSQPSQSQPSQSQPSQSQPSESQQSDFEISNGVLIKYNGQGGHVVVPEGVTTIGDQAFDGCTSLASIAMPAVTTIGRGAFLECTSLASADMPAVETIEQYAFNGCTSLASVVMPGVRFIGSGAFSCCAALTSVDIPGSVTSIGQFAFYRCNNLNVVFCTEETYNRILWSEAKPGKAITRMDPVYVTVCLPPVTPQGALLESSNFSQEKLSDLLTPFRSVRYLDPRVAGEDIALKLQLHAALPTKNFRDIVWTLLIIERRLFKQASKVSSNEGCANDEGNQEVSPLIFEDDNLLLFVCSHLIIQEYKDAKQSSVAGLFSNVLNHKPAVAEEEGGAPALQNHA